ncbi:hypothetical protein [Gymnodinialimonas sp.]
MIRATLLATLLAAPLPGLADVIREDDEYQRARVAAGERISRAVGCREGELTGGGYRMSGADTDAAFIVLANYPLADGRWRVAVRNQSDEAQPLTLWVYALCLID